MKPILLLCCCCAALAAGAQTKTEISTWIPARNTPAQLNRISHTIIVTDKDSLATEVQEYIGGALDCRRIYAYNEKKQRLSENTYNYKGELTRTRNYSYDEAGKLRETSYSYTGKNNATIHVKETFAYDGQGRMIAETYTSDLPETRSWTYEHTTDDEGHKVMTCYKMTNNKRHPESRSTFNEQGLVMQERRKSPEGGGQVNYTYEYTYEQGDWTTRKRYELQQPRPPKLLTEYHKTKLE